jgi:phosphatidylserine/phosphatidylglycerophosphate/cardiolipin synthase-like enzyme
MSDVLSLAKLIAKETEEIKEIKFMERAFLLLESSKKEFEVKNYLELTNDEIGTELSRNVFLGLENRDILQGQEIDEERFNLLFESARFFSKKEEAPENELAANIPSDEGLSLSTEFGNLPSKLRELFYSAERRIVIINPFFSSMIIDKIKPSLKEAAKNGASIIIITRYLTYEIDDKPYNSRFVRNLLDEEEIMESIRLYEYTNDKESTFHAKMVIADNKAYLGTANLTHKGLEDNLELGMIFRDETVSKLAKLVRSIMSSDLLHEVEFKDEKFSRI